MQEGGELEAEYYSKCAVCVCVYMHVLLWRSNVKKKPYSFKSGLQHRRTAISSKRSASLAVWMMSKFTEAERLLLGDVSSWVQIPCQKVTSI